MIFAQQRDGDFGPPHLDPVDAGGDQLGIIAGRIGSNVAADCSDNGGLNLGRRNAGRGSGGLRPSLDQSRGDM